MKARLPVHIQTLRIVRNNLESQSLRARQHCPSAKILRLRILRAPDDYMEYRKYTFLEFSQQEHASCPQSPASGCG